MSYPSNPAEKNHNFKFYVEYYIVWFKIFISIYAIF